MVRSVLTYEVCRGSIDLTHKCVSISQDLGIVDTLCNTSHFTTKRGNDVTYKCVPRGQVVISLDLRSPAPFTPEHRLLGLVVKACASRAEDPGSNPACAEIFRGRVIPVTSKLALQWLPCQAPGVIGSALGLVGPVSVYCDWVR